MIRSRTLILIAGLILASSASSFGQGKSEGDTVRALELKWTESYKQRSIDILSSLLADEFVITVEDGNVYSKAGYISHAADSTCGWTLRKCPISRYESMGIRRS
jgi:hypothetical protein